MKRRADILKGLILFFFVLFTAELLFAQTTLISKGATWKYLDTGVDQGTAWREGSFDDNSWSGGPAQLGYGDGDETTMLNYGNDPNNKYPTYYFRHKFSATNPSQFIFWDMKLVRDDGAVIYLNGTEIYRVNMPAGEITYNTFANADGSDITFFPAEILESSYQYLQNGENTLAVEIHQSSGNSSDLSFDLEFVVWTTQPPSPDIVRKQPYLLFEGINNEMALHWQLNEALPCTVLVGTDTLYSLGNYLTTEYGTDHRHKFIFTNLTPSERYYYKVNMGSDTYVNNFYAAPDNNAINVKFLAYGDTRNNYMDHDALGATILNSFSDGYQTMCLAVGDYSDAGGEEVGLDVEYFNPEMKNIRKLLGSLPLQGAVGDHETAADYGALFRKYFAYPFVSPFASYWSFDYGPVHFVMYDQSVSQVVTGTAYKWLENDLKTTTKPWKIALFHRPGWSTGSNGNMGAVQTIYQPLFEKYNVQMVIAGHNHLYARATVNGIKHITTGGGGAPLYDPSPADQSPNIETYTKAYHYCKINIEGDLLTFTAIATDGRIIDQFTMNSITSVNSPEMEAAQPKEYKLFDAYPNPFNPNTTISFSLPERSQAKLEIFDSIGKLVTTAINADLDLGVYHYKWNASGLASGIYIYKLSAGHYSSSRKLILLK